MVNLMVALCRSVLIKSKLVGIEYRNGPLLTVLAFNKVLKIKFSMKIIHWIIFNRTIAAVHRIPKMRILLWTDSVIQRSQRWNSSIETSSLEAK